MASIFKRKGGKRFHIDFLDVRGRSRRVLGFADRASTKELAAKIERAVAIRQGGGVLAGEMLQWLEGLRPDVRDKLAEWGVIDPQRAAAGKTIAQHVDEWCIYMTAKGNTTGHIRKSKSLVIRLAEGCKWRGLSDASTISAQKWLADAKTGGISISTSNAYIRAAKHFFNWCQQVKRISENPLEFATVQNPRADRRRERRAFTAEEVGKLVLAAEAGKQYCGMTGHQRALVYRLAVETGLRYSEIRSLSRNSFNTLGDPPTVTIAPEDEKAGRGDTLPLRAELAADLETYLAFCRPESKAFPMWADKGSAMIKKDLEAAGIVVKDEYGRVVDFHALRHTFATMLAQANVHPKVAQDLMRHSDINLTMNAYTHTPLESRLDALSKLPNTIKQPTESAEDKGDGSKEASG